MNEKQTQFIFTPTELYNAPIGIRDRREPSKRWTGKVSEITLKIDSLILYVEMAMY